MQLNKINNDSYRILACLFEDTQFHLDELGYRSSIIKGKLVFTNPQNKHFIMENWGDGDIFTYESDSSGNKLEDDLASCDLLLLVSDDLIDDIPYMICKFLITMLPKYLNAIERERVNSSNE